LWLVPDIALGSADGHGFAIEVVLQVLIMKQDVGTVSEISV
jgi:hypothetical protein